MKIKKTNKRTLTTTTNALKKALHEVKKHREAKTKFSLATWGFIKLAVKKYGIEKVSITLGISKNFIKSRLNQMNAETHSSANLNKQPTPIIDGFAVMNLQGLKEPEQDFKIKIKLGHLTLELEGNSNTFQWGKLFANLPGGLTC